MGMMLAPFIVRGETGEIGWPAHLGTVVRVHY
jgi:hypothetical protein